MLGDDLLVCILSGIDIEIVERLTGRGVLAFISNSHVGPDMEMEVFMLAPPGSAPPSD